MVDYTIFQTAKQMDGSVFAWEYKDIANVLEVVLKMQWIILGGDVLTWEGEYTYDSWYYTPQLDVDLIVNVQNSIAKCEDYINAHQVRNGDSYLYSLVLSDSFIGTRRV